MKYTVSDINLMRMKSNICRLTGPALWWSGEAERLTEVCNGVGAEWMPEWAVSVLSFIFRDYSEAAAVHDVRYFLAAGTQEQSDSEFHTNCLKLWRYRYGKLRWLLPSAWADRHKIGLAYKALRLFGGKAWENSKHDNV